MSTEKDVVHKFLHSVSKGEYKFYITKRAFNAMCGTTVGDGEFVRVNQMVYWAYGELQLVWRDVLERHANSGYTPKTIELRDFQKTNPGMFHASFKYKAAAFYADCVGGEWTVCLMDEI